MKDEEAIKMDMWTIVTASALLILVFEVVFVKVWYGSRYKLIVGMILMLGTASICYIVYGFEIAKFNMSCVDNFSNCYVKYFGEGIMKSYGISASFMGVADLLFGEAHWLLAFTYLKLAKNYPRSLAGAVEEVQSYKKTFIAGILCNALFPMLEIATGIWVTLSYLPLFYLFCA